MNSKTIKLELTEEQFYKLYNVLIGTMGEGPVDVKLKVLTQLFFEIDKKLENDKQ